MFAPNRPSVVASSLGLLSLAPLALYLPFARFADTQLEPRTGEPAGFDQ